MNNPLLIPLLMALSNNHSDLEKQLSEFSSFMENTKNSVRTLREGFQTFQTGFHKISQYSATNCPKKPQNPKNLEPKVEKEINLDDFSMPKEDELDSLDNVEDSTAVENKENDDSYLNDFKI